MAHKERETRVAPKFAFTLSPASCYSCVVIDFARAFELFMQFDFPSDAFPSGTPIEDKRERSRAFKRCDVNVGRRKQRGVFLLKIKGEENVAHAMVGWYRAFRGKSGIRVIQQSACPDRFR